MVGGTCSHHAQPFPLCCVTNCDACTEHPHPTRPCMHAHARTRVHARADICCAIRHAAMLRRGTRVLRLHRSATCTLASTPRALRTRMRAPPRTLPAARAPYLADVILWRKLADVAQSDGAHDVALLLAQAQRGGRPRQRGAAGHARFRARARPVGGARARSHQTRALPPHGARGVVARTCRPEKKESPSTSTYAQTAPRTRGDPCQRPPSARSTGAQAARERASARAREQPGGGAPRRIARRATRTGAPLVPTPRGPTRAAVRAGRRRRPRAAARGARRPGPAAPLRMHTGTPRSRRLVRVSAMALAVASPSAGIYMYIDHIHMYIITDSKDTVRVHALTLYMYMAACMGRRAPIMLLPPHGCSPDAVLRKLRGG